MAKSTDKTLAALDKALNRIAEEIVAGVVLLKQDIAREVAETIIEETPVDTGKARSNWVTTERGAYGNIIDAYAPIPSMYKPPYIKGAQRSETANRGAAVKQNALAIDGNKIDSSIHITNNLPYIERLSEGYSKQTASGMVGRAVAAGVAVAKDRKLIK